NFQLPAACAVNTAGGLQCAFDLPDNLTLGPIHEAVKDINYSTIQFAWSSRKGGCLDVQIIFESEGVELAGSYNADIDHIVLHWLLTPTISPVDSTISWDGTLELDYDGDSIAAGFKDTLNAKIAEQLTPVFRPYANTIGQKILALWLVDYVSRVSINDSQAVF